MHSRTSRDQTTKPFSPRILASAVLLALASLSAPSADAAGLGRLTVQSGLGQPLRAEVEVTALSRDEAQSLSARLASSDAFRQAGLEYNPALASLRFSIEPRGGRTYVRITSNQPINEPFVDLLVELNWATGKFVREYTFLLDPPEMRTARESVEGGASRVEVVPPAATTARPSAPAAAPAAPVAQAPAAPAARTPAAEPPAPRAARAPRPSADVPADGVAVRRGDTLAQIARGVRPEGVNLDQAMVAIYRANPSAFIGNNMNLLREGARLQVPDAAAMTAVDAAGASREVRMQSADFSAYRQRLAGGARSIDAPRSGQTAEGAIGGRVEERGSAAGDQLRLSKPGAAAAGAEGAAVGAQSSRSAAEQGVARDAALKEANSRVAELEKNVADLQKLLELKNRSMADLQKQIDEARNAPRTVTGQVGAAPSAQTPTPLTPAPAARTDAPKAPEAAKAPEPAAATPAPDAPKAEAPAPVAGTSDAGRPVEPPKAEAPAQPAPKPAAAPAPEAAEPGLFDDLLENPFLLPGLGGIALLGAGYGWYAMRRRRKVEKFEDSLIAADAFTANSLFGSTGGQSVDTANSVFASPAAAAVDVHATEVDPIAEADVYIAYGREAQAEDILKEALKRQPERQAIRAKLLEIYSGRKDAKTFETVAREMHDMTGGQNEEWPKVQTMGLAIDPDNPLYGGGQLAAPNPALAAGAAGMGATLIAGAALPEPRDDLSFPSMDFGAPATGIDASPGTTTGLAPAAPAPRAEEEVADLDFDLDLDTRIDKAANLDGAEISDTLTGQAHGADDLARFDLPSLDLDLGAGGTQASSEPEPPVLEREPRPLPAADDTSLDLDIPALETLTAPAPQGPSGGGVGAFDLSPISLDLEPATAVAEEAEAALGGASGRWQEMATKLDLASAYEEIGDKEGARELLQEVIRGGDGGQQQKARAMLAKIG